MTRLRLALVLVLASVLPTTVLAEGGAKAATQKAPPVEYKRFLVFVLDDLYRTPFPADPRGMGYHRALQKLNLSKIRAVLVKYEKDTPKELIGPFDDYQKVMKMLEELNKQLDATYAKHLDLAADSVKQYWNAQNNFRAAVGQANAANAISGMGLLLDVLGDRGVSGRKLNEMMYVNLSGQLRVNAAKGDLARAENAMREALIKANNDFALEAKPYYDEEIKKISEFRAALPGVSAATLSSLAERYKWKSTPVFDPKSEVEDWPEGTAPENPLHVIRAIRNRPIPDGIESVAAYLRNAQDALAAARRVPSQFPQYREKLCWVALYEANLASEAQVGTAGFSQGATKAAPTAQAAAELFKTVKGLALTDSVEYHQAFLAYAYGGQKEKLTAFTAVSLLTSKTKQNDFIITNPPTNTAFWLDAARLCSVMRRTEPGFRFLATAVQRGVPNMDDIRVHGDFENLRTADSTRFRKITGQ